MCWVICGHPHWHDVCITAALIVIWTEGWPDTLRAVWEVEFLYTPLPLHPPVAALQVQIQHSRQQHEDVSFSVCV